MQPTLVVLAAGLGSRFGSLKQMQPLGPHGEVVLDYAVWDALLAGFGRVVFVVREDFAAQFKDRIGHAFARHIAVDYVFQDMASPGISFISASRLISDSKTCAESASFAVCLW